MSTSANDQLRKQTFRPGQWPRKTVDIGANGFTVSANPLGQIYQISAPLDARSKYGIMVAAPWAQFNHRERENREYVREFRKNPEKLLIEQRNGLGLAFGGVQGPVVMRHVGNSMGSHAQFEYDGGSLFVQTVLKVHDDGSITHASKVTNMDNIERQVPVALDLEFAMRLLMKLDGQRLAELLPNNDELAGQYETKIHQALTNHLTWLFKIATTSIEIKGKVRHFWRRSYLVNGLPKDAEVYQLDTQCYPFLELCEYFERYQSRPGTTDVVKSILTSNPFKNILQDVLSRQDTPKGHDSETDPDTKTNLFATEETSADDDSEEYPFLLSSNILLWYTLRKLDCLLSRPEFPDSEAPDLVLLQAQLEPVTVVIRENILKHFISQINGKAVFAYGLDPSRGLNDPERLRYYHDSNDLPTLYARDWGFLKSDGGDRGQEQYLRKLWECTMLWAFTPNPDPESVNRAYAGTGTEPFHGLGSDHTPGPWTLGFFQEWKFAQMVRDRVREDKAWRQIQGSAQFDGTFSEAVDIETGLCTSKTWFSWPGAMIAENLIGTVIGQVQGSP
ncbi:hypothetical protein KVR01_010511 [Diaporthe batatas]|uniref:uncharacterized protein n=1 Tax=Diaporthe batatas TaxID=748121 RepID=UPI001D04D323|nr:uncharacterized protein KVR01_010511 [Diaporthe batatas]KAG8159874.1 hypothetical protein KVR01_010511 [Diaporthe batatas]